MYVICTGHLPKKEQDYKRKFRPLAATYVTFSPDGNELLVNLGGEQVRTFIPLIFVFCNLNIKNEDLTVFYNLVGTYLSITFTGRFYFHKFCICFLDTLFYQC